MLPPPINPTAMIQFAALWNWHRLQQTLDEKIYIRADRVAFVRPDRWEPWNDELHCERREASDGQMRRLASPSRLVRVPHRNMQAISFQQSRENLKGDSSLSKVFIRSRLALRTGQVIC
ncbi:hypothetical protein PGTUg99_010429 [Puccinia graminis f. sp. tritici]|uniref:Uncharacterized protein n=1 Tax=Puccinia graminis f. sp. tritici TaxID=56615 RepID=A0A5B0S0B3_PUCGR|nr:hypothetical protein PGTUg99_010429 [Puccinia graminis f. sp. tritici]